MKIENLSRLRLWFVLICNCWYYIAMSPRVGWNRKGVETIYDVCTTHVFSSSSDFTYLWYLAELCWCSTCQHGGSDFPLVQESNSFWNTIENRITIFSTWRWQFHLTPNLDLTDGNLADSFRKWKRQLKVYMEASGANNKLKQRQTAIILHCAGPQVLEVYDKNDPVKVLEKLEEYLNPRENEVLQSFRFWNIPFHEPFGVFLTELYARAASCNFKEKERMIRDKIVFSVSGKLEELLLRESNLDLKKATEIFRVFKITSWAKKEISPPSEGYPIDKIEAQHQKKQNNAVKPQQKDGPRVLKECNFPGQSHEAAKTQCPACGKTCNYCKGRNHYEVKCKKVNLLNAGRDSDECDGQWWAVVGADHKCVTALMQVNGCEVRFPLDSGADVNIICQKFVKKSRVKSTSQKLIMWNKWTVTPFG